MALNRTSGVHSDYENTIQAGIKGPNNQISQYSLFLGGLNVTNEALKQYDPLKTGYARIFFIKMPAFLEVNKFKNMTKDFKHMLEYGFTRIDGLGNLSLETEQLTGGYAGRQFETATVSKDETNAITISLYEFAGSPVRTYIDTWISGIADPYTGLATYHGADMEYMQANHVAEAIYVNTDPTGNSDGIEYACLLTNMMPKSVSYSHFNYEAGNHPLTTIDCEFTCTKYQSKHINLLAKQLVKKQQILNDYINFNPNYTSLVDSWKQTADASWGSNDKTT